MHDCRISGDEPAKPQPAMDDDETQAFNVMVGSFSVPEDTGDEEAAWIHSGPSTPHACDILWVATYLFWRCLRVCSRTP